MGLLRNKPSLSIYMLRLAWKKKKRKKVLLSLVQILLIIRTLRKSYTVQNNLIQLQSWFWRHQLWKPKCWTHRILFVSENHYARLQNSFGHVFHPISVIHQHLPHRNDQQVEGAGGFNSANLCPLGTRPISNKYFLDRINQPTATDISDSSTTPPQTICQGVSK